MVRGKKLLITLTMGKLGYVSQVKQENVYIIYIYVCVCVCVCET